MYTQDDLNLINAQIIEADKIADKERALREKDIATHDVTDARNIQAKNRLLAKKADIEIYLATNPK